MCSDDDAGACLCLEVLYQQQLSEREERETIVLLVLHQLPLVSVSCACLRSGLRTSC